MLTFTTNQGRILKSSQNFNQFEYRNGEELTCITLPYKIGPSELYLDGLRFGFYVCPDSNDQLSLDEVWMKYVIAYTEG